MNIAERIYYKVNELYFIARDFDDTIDDIVDLTKDITIVDRNSKDYKNFRKEIEHITTLQEIWGRQLRKIIDVMDGKNTDQL